MTDSMHRLALVLVAIAITLSISSALHVAP